MKQLKYNIQNIKYHLLFYIYYILTPITIDADGRIHEYIDGWLAVLSMHVKAWLCFLISNFVFLEKEKLLS